MKLTENILSIPPYLSTTWGSISSMHAKEEAGTLHLIIALHSGHLVEIPSLDRESIQRIFDAHAQYAAQGGQDNSVQWAQIPFAAPHSLNGQEEALPEALGPLSQHNPDQSNLPPLPSGILGKIVALAKNLGIDADTVFPTQDANCNCIHCQIIRALKAAVQEEPMPEEEVSLSDLQFRNWDVEETADKLYHVTNPLDHAEQYRVYLGEPLGCTCGQKNCEHIRAVLHT